jgi:hypothetical protein
VNHAQYYTHRKRKITCGIFFFRIPFVCMPNTPHPETVTASFTMPRRLLREVEDRARAELTNKSDIIRRALLAYLPPDARAAVVKSVAEDVAEYKAKPKRRRKT